MSRSPAHRTSTPIRDSAAEVVYLMGRIGLIVLLMLATMVLIVSLIMGVAWVVVVILRGYVGS